MSTSNPNATPRQVWIDCCCGDGLSLGPGKGPHAARLSCSRCGRFIKWVGKAALAEMQELERGDLLQGELTDALQRFADDDGDDDGEPWS